MNSPHEHQTLKDYLIMDYRNSKDRLDELLSLTPKPSLGAIMREVSHQVYLLNQPSDQKPEVNYPNSVTIKIASLLEARSLEFIRVSHPPSRTSAECLEARRTSGKEAEGAKAILIRVTEQSKNVSFALCVLPGRRQIDSKLLKNKLGVKKISFASHEELHELTGMIPGTMPPFIAPVFPKLKFLYIDEALLSEEWIGFNAGCLTQSFVMRTQDYLAIAQPFSIFSFSKLS